MNSRSAASLRSPRPTRAALAAAGIFLLSLATAVPAAEPALPPARLLLFNSGQEGYPRYRIPTVIVAPYNDVLALAEGRVAGGGFTGSIDLVMKRSTDSSKTWGPVRKIADDGPHTFGYPTPVVERQRKKTSASTGSASRSRGCSSVENKSSFAIALPLANATPYEITDADF